MPRAFVRLLAAVLLALVVPVQGMAAVAAGQCMALGHHQNGAGDHDQGHAHDTSEAHDHASHSHPAEDGANPGDEPKQAHCGPCTACCASATIAGSASIPFLPASTYTKYAYFQLPPLGIQPDGLDRPPLAL